MRKEITLKTKDNREMTCLEGCLPGQKAVILCLHGLAGDKNSSVISRLSQVMEEEGIGTFTFDWPAHGDNREPSRSFTTEICLEYIETAAAYLKERCGSIPLYCFATSFGGYMAVLYHLSHPDTFDKIFLRSPALNIGETITGFMNEEQLRRFLEGSALDFGFEKPLLLTKAVYEDVKNHDVFSRTPRYPEKIFIMHGKLDDVVPVEDSKAYSEKNGIGLYILEGADHRYKNPGDLDMIMEQARKWFV